MTAMRLWGYLCLSVIFVVLGVLLLGISFLPVIGMLIFPAYLLYQLNFGEDTSTLALEKWLWRLGEATPFIIFLLLASYVLVAGGVPELLERWEDFNKSLFLTMLATALILPLILYLVTPPIQRMAEWYLSVQEQEPEVVEYKAPKSGAEAEDWSLSYLRGAMRRVNVDLFQSDCMLDDLGLLVYRDAKDEHPELIRVHPIPKKARFLRPFVAIQPWQQWQNPKAVSVILEICEENSKVLYQYEGVADWVDSDTALILPTTWLDVSTAAKDLGDKNWSVRVHVDGNLLASHPVYWSKFDEEDIAKGRRRDGEISMKLRRLMEQEHRSTNISLDDLLADQTSYDN